MMRKSIVRRVVSGVLLGAMVLGCLLQTGCGKSFKKMTAKEVVDSMGVGFNIGNSLDATGGYNVVYQETAWGNYRITKELMDALKEKGFTTVRIPCTWYKALSEDGEYTINDKFLARVKEVVDYAYEDGLYVILNTMHEDFTENKNLVDDEVAIGEELSKIWAQLADTFADYDYHLIFEAMNEPRAKDTGSEWNANTKGNATINYLNQVFVNTIRANGKGYNNERCLMIPTYAASSASVAMRGTSLPTVNGEVCNNLIMSIHSYTPYDFCLSDQSDTFSENGQKSITQVYEDIKTYYLDYDIPVIMGETGATNTKNNTAERTAWAKYFAETSASYGVPVCMWDNGNNDVTGGECHSYIDRETAEWRSEYVGVIDAFIEGFAGADRGSKATGREENTTADKKISYYANGTLYDTSASYVASPSYTNMTFDGWYTTPTFEPDTKLDITTISGEVNAYAKYSLDLEAAKVKTPKNK